MKITVERLDDSWDCEACGSSWAQGGRIFKDGVFWFELTPSAHCFDGDNYEDEDILIKIIEQLGHDVTIG